MAIGDTVVFTGGFWNYSASKFHLTLGIKLVDGNGKATYVESFVSDSFDMYYGYPYFSMEASAFPAGNKAYAVYPACRDEEGGRWYDIKVQPATGRGYLIAEVSEQGIEFSMPAAESSKLEAGSPELLTKAYAGSRFKVKARLTNSGAEYFDDVRVAVLEPGRMDPLLVSDPVMAALRQGESHEVEFTVTAPAGTGAYELAVVDADNTVISGRTPVTVEEAPQGELALGLLSAPVVADSSNVSAGDIRVTVQVECTSGYYNGMLYALVYPGGRRSRRGVCGLLHIAALHQQGRYRHCPLQRPDGISCRGWQIWAENILSGRRRPPGCNTVRQQRGTLHHRLADTGGER